MRRYSNDSNNEEEEKQNFENENSKKENSKEKKIENENEIFIKNIPFSTTEEELENYFSKYGKIKKTNILKKNGHSKGIGFITFNEKKSCEKLFENEKYLELEGRKLFISYSNKNYKNNLLNNSKTLFIGNLSLEINEEKLENFFSEYGKITDIRIAKNLEGKNKGFAHIDFENEKNASEALKKNGEELDGKRLIVNKTFSKNDFDKYNNKRKYRKDNKRDFRQNYDDRKNYDRKSYERKSYERKNYDERKNYERKNYDNRKNYERRNYDRRSNERKSYDRRSNERKNYDRRSYDRRSSERRSYDKHYRDRSRDSW